MATENVIEAREDMLLPNAKRENLVICENPDELLVYDLSNHKAHCLNKSAALTWTRCDGKTTVADLVAVLSQELNVQVDDDTVWLALRQLDKARLLQGPVGTPEGMVNRSRRDVVRKLGLGGALAVPVVMSILAPKASAAATLVNGAPCSANNQCTSGCCDRQPAIDVCAADSGGSGGTRLPGVPCTNPNQCCTDSCSTVCVGS